MHGDCKKNTEIGTLVVYLTVIVMLDSGVETKANPNIQISFSEHRRQPKPTRRENVTLPFTYATVKQVRHFICVLYFITSAVLYLTKSQMRGQPDRLTHNLFITCSRRSMPKSHLNEFEIYECPLFPK